MTAWTGDFLGCSDIQTSYVPLSVYAACRVPRQAPRLDPADFCVMKFSACPAFLLQSSAAVLPPPRRVSLGRAADHHPSTAHIALAAFRCLEGWLVNRLWWTPRFHVTQDFLSRCFSLVPPLDVLAPAGRDKEMKAAKTTCHTELEDLMLLENSGDTCTPTPRLLSFNCVRLDLSYSYRLILCQVFPRFLQHRSNPAEVPRRRKLQYEGTASFQSDRQVFCYRPADN